MSPCFACQGRPPDDHTPIRMKHQPRPADWCTVSRNNDKHKFDLAIIMKKNKNNKENLQLSNSSSTVPPSNPYFCLQTTHDVTCAPIVYEHGCVGNVEKSHVEKSRHFVPYDHKFQNKLRCQCFVPSIQNKLGCHYSRNSRNKMWSIQNKLGSQCPRKNLEKNLHTRKPRQPTGFTLNPKALSFVCATSPSLSPALSATLDNSRHSPPSSLPRSRGILDGGRAVSPALLPALGATLNNVRHSVNSRLSALPAHTSATLDADLGPAADSPPSSLPRSRGILDVGRADPPPSSRPRSRGVLDVGRDSCTASVDHSLSIDEMDKALFDGPCTPIASAPAVAVDDSSAHFNNALMYDPTSVGSLSRTLRRTFVRLCNTFALDDGSTPIRDFVALIPHVHSCRFAELLKMSIAVAESLFPVEATVRPDFDPVALFEYMADSIAITSDTARYVFNQLLIGGGKFPSLYDGVRAGNVVAKNGRRLVVPAMTDPYPSPLPKHANSQRRRHLDQVSLEVGVGRYRGPYTQTEADNLFASWSSVSSFLLSKPAAISSKERLVHNFTDPKHPVNLMLDKDLMSTVSLDHTSIFIDSLRLRAAGGKQLHMVTADISKGYRRMHSRRQDVQHLGLRVDVDFDGTIPYYDGSSVCTRTVKKGDVLFMFDRSLPFGLTTSVSSFCSVSKLIRDIVQEKLGPDVSVLQYVDDSVLLGAPEIVAEGIVLLRHVLALIGLPENIKKMMIPGPIGTYLGVDYNLSNPEAVTASLPKEKRLRYVKHLQYYLKSAIDGVITLSRLQLQSVVGKLAHAAHIFQSGKPFYQRLLHALRGNRNNKAASRIVLPKSCTEDIDWWINVLTNHTGTLLINPPQRTVKVYTDASTSTGYGVILNGQFFHGTWPKEVADQLVDFHLTINELELIALNFALETFSHQLHGTEVLFRCDNAACVANISSCSSKIPIRATLLRRLFSVAAKHGITLRSTYINTKNNLHADSLSRADMKFFFSLPQFYPLVQVKPNLTAMDLLTNLC